MSDSELNHAAKCEEFENLFKTLLARFESLEHVLIGQYGVKPGEWQRIFSDFADSLVIAHVDAIDFMQDQANLNRMYLDHIEHKAEFKG